MVLLLSELACVGTSAHITIAGSASKSCPLLFCCTIEHIYLWFLVEQLLYWASIGRFLVCLAICKCECGDSSLVSNFVPTPVEQCTRRRYNKILFLARIRNISYFPCGETLFHSPGMSLVCMFGRSFRLTTSLTQHAHCACLSNPPLLAICFWSETEKVEILWSYHPIHSASSNKLTSSNLSLNHCLHPSPSPYILSWAQIVFSIWAMKYFLGPCLANVSSFKILIRSFICQRL